MIKLLGFILITTTTLKVFAQVDASNTILVQSQESPAAVVGPNLDSSRYVVKPSVAEKIVEVKKKIEKKISEKSATEKPAEEPMTPATVPAPQNVDVNKNFTEELKAILLGGDEERMNQYLTQVHPQDPRQNIVNLSVAAGYLYQDSTSEYWYRKFYSSGPGITVGADIWLSPMLGINIDYYTTLSADVTAAPDSSKKIVADHRYINVGFQFRRFSSFSRKSPYVTWGIQYSEYQMIVPKGEDHRVILKSSGPNLNVMVTVPKTNSSAWIVGGDFYPNMKVEEEKTAIQVKSGASPTSYGFKFTIGQLHTIDRASQMFWRLSHRVDKTVYSGDASPVDPISSTTLSGVSVTTGTSMFEVGYTWGD